MGAYIIVLIPNLIGQIPIPTRILSGLHRLVYKGIDLHCICITQVRFHPQSLQFGEKMTGKICSTLAYGVYLLGVVP